MQMMGIAGEKRTLHKLHNGHQGFGILNPQLVVNLCDLRVRPPLTP
jgi:hypothetical protein